MLCIIRGLNKKEFVVNVPLSEHPTDEHAKAHLGKFVFGGIQFSKSSEDRAWIPVFDQVETAADWEARLIWERAQKYGWPSDDKNLLEPFVLPPGTQNGDFSFCFRGIYAVTRGGKETSIHTQFMCARGHGPYDISPIPIFDGPYRNCVRREERGEHFG